MTRLTILRAARRLDQPFIFTALAVALLIFAVVWTAPWPQLCPAQPEQTTQTDQAVSGIGQRSALAARQEPTERGEAKCDEKANADWWATRIGAVTVLVLFGQFLMFGRQLNAMWEAVRDSTKYAAAATSQARVITNTFNKLGRPYLYISGISRLITDLEDDTYVTYSVANHGTIAAKIEAVWIQNWGETGAVPTHALLESLSGELLGNRVFGPGEVRRNIHSYAPSNAGFSFRNYGTEHQYTVPKLAPDEEYFFDITIRYSGPFTEGHVTRACWRWDEDENAFVELNNPSFNYMS